MEFLSDWDCESEFSASAVVHQLGSNQSSPVELRELKLKEFHPSPLQTAFDCSASTAFQLRNEVGDKTEDTAGSLDSVVCLVGAAEFRLRITPT
ncbi:hypothetical protein BV898_02914 [Hypsibius exemplaris]|uniref:Uncharacterized protein n=1 Tax=Hypsibius exemplaris TaxID=2072580 RepID=A0A1W0X7F1_HYPEX|nr:hypothetical protein BV898_02914 [Hypsibius exemplaris]